MSVKKIDEKDMNFLNGDFEYICTRFNRFIPTTITNGRAEDIKLKFPNFDDELYYAFEILNHKSRYRDFNCDDIYNALRNEYSSRTKSYLAEFIEPEIKNTISINNDSTKT